MKIDVDKRGTIVNIQFCCMKFAKKIMPGKPHRDAPIIIFDFFYCPYCGERIVKEELDMELYDPFCTKDLEESPNL